MRIHCWAWMTVLLLVCVAPSRGQVPTPWPEHSPEADPLAGIERTVVPRAWSPHQAVFSVARSRDGRLLAIRRGDHVAFYDAITGVLTARFAGEIPPDLRLLSFSSGRSLALLHGRGAGLWLFDLATGDQKHRWVGDSPEWAGDRFVAFESYPRRGDIRYIDAAAAKVAPRTVQLLDPTLDECVDRNACGYVLIDGFHRQPRVIAAPTPPRKVPAIYIIDLEQGKVVKRIDVPGAVSSLSVSPDDQTIVDERPTKYGLSGILVSRAVGVAAEFTAYLPFE